MEIPKITIPSKLDEDSVKKNTQLEKIKQDINNFTPQYVSEFLPKNVYISNNNMSCEDCEKLYKILDWKKNIETDNRDNDLPQFFYVIPKSKIIIESPELLGGKKSKRKSSKKKKGGSVPINSQATVLQSASYAPSLDNAFLSQSTLVGGKKKRTQKKRKSLKKRSRK